MIEATFTWDWDLTRSSGKRSSTTSKSCSTIWESALKTVFSSIAAADIRQVKKHPPYSPGTRGFIIKKPPPRGGGIEGAGLAKIVSLGLVASAALRTFCKSVRGNLRGSKYR